MFQDRKNMFLYGKCVKTILRVASHYKPFPVWQTRNYHFPCGETLKSLSVWQAPKTISRVMSLLKTIFRVASWCKPFSVSRAAKKYFLCGKFVKTIFCLANSYELTIQEQIFMVLKHRNWLLGVCQTENGFYELATQKIFFGCLRHGKWFSPACHTENSF